MFLVCQFLRFSSSMKQEPPSHASSNICYQVHEPRSYPREPISLPTAFCLGFTIWLFLLNSNFCSNFASSLLLRIHNLSFFCSIKKKKKDRSFEGNKTVFYSFYINRKVITPLRLYHVLYLTHLFIDRHQLSLWTKDKHSKPFTFWTLQRFKRTSTYKINVT